ncbi:phosphatase PAP2 family protein [Hoeflea sp. G2-23]|uniref:Phosphatase PAP2 family protein n=1 Tax=Hoeflea algicola TaxID=2983763 RepID=A0ABT3Z4V4_9HYPH|nr:phosphatase PAP2 family protein [Hoeflea algicola]MCY0146799.1 phosphatase PAP2 family protein [Hoeflea algicola]
MYGLDVAVTRWINGLSGLNPTLDAVMIATSEFGIPILVLAVACQWWTRPNREHVRHVLIASGLSFLLGLALNQIVLLFVSRIRPYDNGVTDLLIARSADFSFPSDHATASMAIAAAFLLHGMTRRGMVFMLAAVLIAFSRIYIGTHYAADIIGAAATAMAAALAVRLAYREGTRLDRFVTAIL